MNCQHCGASLSAGAATCAACGGSVPPAGGGAHASGGGTPPPAPGPAPGPVHPSGLPSDVRNWAMAAHLSAFAGSLVALAVLGPLVVWLIRREEDGFSELHAREALNFNLTLLLLIVAGGVISVLTLGIALIVVIPVGLVLGVAWIALTVLAAVRASEGREYRYPLTIRFVS